MKPHIRRTARGSVKPGRWKAPKTLAHGKRKNTPCFKRCPKCKQQRRRSSFTKNCPYCRLCAAKRALKLWHKDRDRFVGYWRKWHLANPDKVLLYHARQRAKKLDLPFSITTADVQIPKRCPILGIPLLIGHVKGPKDNSPTVDRIDNRKGYVPKNVWVVSWRANRIKSDASLKELKKIVGAIEGGTR